MLTTVNLKDQPVFVTCEIHDEGADGGLPPELQSI